MPPKHLLSGWYVWVVGVVVWVQVLEGAWGVMWAATWTLGSGVAWMQWFPLARRGVSEGRLAVAWVAQFPVAQWEV